MATLKTCFKCWEEKNRCEFYAHPAMADGLLGKCKTCTKRDVRLHRMHNDSVREYDRKRSSFPERLAQRKKNLKRFRAIHPERMRAHSALNRAVRIGTVKQHPCFVCGEKAEGHHWSYDRKHWLLVVWLCPLHHRRAHAVAENEVLE